MITHLLFWFAASLIAYTFVGYPLLLFAISRFRARPILRDEIYPEVTFLIAVHNEARNIARKLENIFSLAYPAPKIRVIVVSDGSSDESSAILAGFTDTRLQVIHLPARVGKASALNHAIRAAISEILIFTDARQILEKNSVRNMVSNFADMSVGCVSGELMLGELNDSVEVTGEQLKWSLENHIRRWEGLTSSVVGALGAFYAARANFVLELPAGTLLDDCYIPLNIVRQCKRTVFETSARAWDDFKPTPKQEFQRKVRTLTGNYQLIKMAPWLLGPLNPVWFQFVSHKLCRLGVPFAFITLLATSLLSSQMEFKVFAVLQLVFYGTGLIAFHAPKHCRVARYIDVPKTFIVMIAAGVVALANFLQKKEDVWTREPPPIATGNVPIQRARTPR